ncbi:MAG TPA: hypothetical protein VGO43_03445 [Pyrinomonadaceae bacterium]|nr:hypothetical protein [Pyrinomonadaceae bacterium]
MDRAGTFLVKCEAGVGKLGPAYRLVVRMAVVLDDLRLNMMRARTGGQ